MTDQPETMMEYHFRKLSRRVVHTGMILSSVVMLVGAGTVMNTDPLMGGYFAFGSLGMLAAAHAARTDGRVRAAFNYTLRTDLSDIERPDGRDHTEVPADD